MNENIKEILNILNNKGFSSYVIGGYVRDHLLIKETNDYDICTSALPNDLKLIFKDNILSCNYGSLKIKYNNEIFEITTFRKDINYINNRKPEKIAFIDDLYQDLQRRDFTINTICMDSFGNIIDLLNGRKDLENKIIKVVGNTDNKICEDSLRILRAIRFATTLNFKLDNNLFDSIKRNGYLVKNLSYNRKRVELNKIFSSNNVEYGIKLLKDLNLDKYLDLNLTNIKITSLIGIWAQINNMNYPFTKEEKKIITKVNEINSLDGYNLYKYGLDICLIFGEINGIDKNIIKNNYQNLPIKTKKDIKLNKDIYNLLQHSDIKTIINDIEYKIINKTLINDEKEILKYIQKTYL